MIPKLSDLTPEQRRVLAAEEIGWVNVRNTTVLKGRVMRSGWWGCPPQLKNAGYTSNELIPNPDQSHDDAFRLVEFMREKGWRYNVSNDEWKGGHNAQFIWPDYSVLHEMTEPTAPQAITSAFLLATGRAKE